MLVANAANTGRATARSSPRFSAGDCAWPCYAFLCIPSGSDNHAHILVCEAEYVGSPSDVLTKQPPATPVSCGLVDTDQNRVVPHVLQK